MHCEGGSVIYVVKDKSSGCRLQVQRIDLLKNIEVIGLRKEPANFWRYLPSPIYSNMATFKVESRLCEPNICVSDFHIRD